MPAKKLPCIIDGIRYGSISEAAKALGVYPSSVQFRLRSSNFPNYTSKHQTKVKRKMVSTSCTIKGVEYVSVADVARKLKIKASTISNRLRSFNFPDYVCATIPKKPPTPSKYSYTVNGKEYRTLQEIGDAEGLTREGIRQRMNNPKYPGYQRI